MSRKTNLSYIFVVCLAMVAFMLMKHTLRLCYAWPRDIISSIVYIHAFSDGRDTSPTGGVEFMQLLETRARGIGGDHPAKVATVSGRYYAMDRDNRWDRTGMTYLAIDAR